MTRTAIAVLLAANALVIEHPLLAKAPKAAPSASSPAATAASRPNLVFVLADQLRYQSCGFAGDARARTPNLDTFAKQGVIFRNAVSGHPVCAAYRASLFTGKYTTSTGMVINELRMNPNHDCLAHVLTRGGYDTAYIGKWHLWANELGNHEDPKNSYTPSGPYRLGFDGFWAAYNFHHEYYKGYYHTDSPKKIPVKGYEPDVQTELAIGQIKRHARGGKPFALVLAIGTPHDPWHSNNVPPEYYAMFADQGKEPRFALPPNYKPENDPYSDAWGRFRGPGERQAILRWLRAYYAMTVHLRPRRDDGRAGAAGKEHLLRGSGARAIRDALAGPDTRRNSERRVPQHARHHADALGLGGLADPRQSRGRGLEPLRVWQARARAGSGVHAEHRRLRHLGRRLRMARFAQQAAHLRHLPERPQGAAV